MAVRKMLGGIGSFPGLVGSKGKGRGGGGLLGRLSGRQAGSAGKGSGIAAALAGQLGGGSMGRSVGRTATAFGANVGLPVEGFAPFNPFNRQRRRL